MFILIQSKEEKIRYIVSDDIDKLEKFIYDHYSKVRKYSRFFYKDKTGIEFKIVVGDRLT